MLMHGLHKQWFPSIPTSLSPKKSNGLFFRCLQSFYKNSMHSLLLFFKASAYSHLLITGPFYTWEKMFKGKGHLRKKLPPVRYICSACCNGHTVHFKNTSHGLVEKYTSFIRRQVQIHFLLLLFSGLLKQPLSFKSLYALLWPQ